MESQYDDLPAGIGQYDDFHTIDWLRDIAVDRIRHKLIVKKRLEGCCDKIKAAFDACSGWLCMICVGIFAGIMAVFIDVGASWMFGLKDGICVKHFWHNLEQCCHNLNTSSLGAVVECEEWHSWGSMIGGDSTNGPYIAGYLIYVLWSLLFAMLAATLVKIFAPYSSGSGIPEIKTILGGFIIRDFLSRWTLLIKALGMMLGVAAGLSLGKEGPFVHVCCCCGNILSDFFPKFKHNEAKRREIISASSAAGMSVAFGSPVGGVLFSLEELEVRYLYPLKDLLWAFLCAVTAFYMLLHLVLPGSTSIVGYTIDYSSNCQIQEYIPFILIGILGGLYGAMFIKFNIMYARYKKFSFIGSYPLLEVLAVAFTTAVLSYPNPYARMNTSELIKQLLNTCQDGHNGLCELPPLDREFYGDLWKLSLALVLKIVMTIITVTLKIPAGLFVPNLCIGAIVGRMIGISCQQMALGNRDSLFFSNMFDSDGNCLVVPGVYAMVGAVAAVGGVTRVVVSLVVIVIEAVGGGAYIMPCLVGAILSKWVGDSLGHLGIYDAQIALSGFPYLDSKEEFLHTTVAADVMRPRCWRYGTGVGNDPPLVVLPQDSLTVDETESLLHKTEHNGFPVVVSRDSQYLVGFVLKRDLNLAIASAKRANDRIDGTSIVYFTEQVQLSPSAPLKLRQIMNLAPLTITDQTPMETVVEMFRKLGLRQTLVTHNGRLLGIITKKDVLRHIAVLEHHDPESILFD